MVTCPNVTMRNQSQVHFITSFKIILTSLRVLSRRSFLGTMEDTRTVLFSC